MNDHARLVINDIDRSPIANVRAGEELILEMRVRCIRLEEKLVDTTGFQADGSASVERSSLEAELLVLGLARVA